MWGTATIGSNGSDIYILLIDRHCYFALGKQVDLCEGMDLTLVSWIYWLGVARDWKRRVGSYTLKENERNTV